MPQGRSLEGRRSFIRQGLGKTGEFIRLNETLPAAFFESPDLVSRGRSLDAPLPGLLENGMKQGKKSVRRERSRLLADFGMEFLNVTLADRGEFPVLPSREISPKLSRVFFPGPFVNLCMHLKILLEKIPEPILFPFGPRPIRRGPLPEAWDRLPGCVLTSNTPVANGSERVKAEAQWRGWSAAEFPSTVAPC